MATPNLSNIIGFEWDTGNIDKSFQKHGITTKEAEEIFLDINLKVQTDIKHSETEERFIGIGKTSENKILFTIFITRNNKIRIISARIANKKERSKYEQKNS